MRKTTALGVAVLALCTALVAGCRHGVDRSARSGQPGTVQTGGGTGSQTGNAGGGSSDPGTVATEVSGDLDQIDELLRELDDQQTKANQPLPDAD